VNGPYFAIQAALDAAAPGDTIEVAPGVYHEALHASVPLTLRSREGPGVTILDGQARNRLLEFRHFDLVVEGFTFQNGRAWAGAAIEYSIGSLRARNCRFRSNHAYNSGGGAVLASGWSRGEFTECSFVGNLIGWMGSGGAIWIRESTTETNAGPSEVSVEGMEASGEPLFRFLRCSFVSNRCAQISAIRSTKLIDVQNCLFADKQGSNGPFVEAPLGSTFACNLYHSPASPEFEGTWAMAATEEEVDPRICPESPETIHESSPAVMNWQGCGPIGSLTVGCTGPLALAVRPLELEAVGDQVIRVYGYGLEEVLEARLEGPLGARVPWNDPWFDGPLLTATFDLEGQARGDWALVLRTATDGEIRKDGLVLGNQKIWGFFDGWVPEPTLYSGRIAGKQIGEGVTLSLQHADQGPLLPVEVFDRATDDTLLVRVDLRTAVEGAYDLLIDFPTGESLAIRPALYLGTPPVFRVPADAPTIGAALDAAPPCAEIRVDAGTYRESLTIRRPVRLRGERVNTPPFGVHIRPATLGQRGILVLPEAGPLTEIDELQISQSEVSGPGAGILSLAPALIRDCGFTDNRAAGPGARGAGLRSAAGSRIIGNYFYGNEARSAIQPGDPWSTSEETGGVAGGLFCLGCWVEANDFEGDYAESASEIVADGVIRRNTIREGWAWSGPWLLGALRGEIAWNRFGNCCGSDKPYFLIDGPSRLIRNVFTEFVGQLCDYPNTIHLRGSMDLTENVFATMGIQACLATNPVDEPLPGHFRMDRNYMSADMGFHFDLSGSCAAGGGELQIPITPDSIRFTCNIRDRSEVTLGGSPCGTCAYQLADLPPGCPDTIPSFEYVCELTPVLLQSYGLEATSGGVRLFWSVPLDHSVDGFDVLREHGGYREIVNGERLSSCHDCEYLDAAPPYGERTTYRLLVYSGGGDPAEVLLGTWDGRARAGGGGTPRVLLPAPHPVRSTANLRLDLPAEMASVRLDVLDLQGRRMALVREGPFAAGVHTIPWEARDGQGRPLPSGVYLLRLSDGRADWTRKFLLLR
jgi:hypothetical protein